MLCCSESEWLYNYTLHVTAEVIPLKNVIFDIILWSLANPRKLSQTSELKQMTGWRNATWGLFNSLFALTLRGLLTTRKQTPACLWQQHWHNVANSAEKQVILPREGLWNSLTDLLWDYFSHVLTYCWHDIHARCAWTKETLYLES